jgi:cell division GTPase FtsZ
MALLVCNTYFVDRVMKILRDNAKGKGHGTEPHLGSRAYQAANREIQRAADHIRLFQLPLERIV